MEKTFIGVRNVDENTFRKFKAMSIQERIKIGEALTQAMRKMLEVKKKKTKTSRAFTLKPFDFGPGTEKTSQEIDKILYGE